ncbi:zinc ribbon domain-containing protein [Herbiconiux sp. CPCC 203407]|uniref:Zinc ribbon domain-containing protein n=1 Tax=Herbiconiux oxytropis TaxID=2970915 RepID=A0AA42BVN6_9MICO|nr:zinc ribbon domain-containing protein [Herbiconiux oxytropis]MCS5721664.1 zinc ribbon domain-containing protein [Herbiconiux oxytropis]MCS5726709.1 zinc ribbon domain-containing protein [Herbiconiux oxytropis]
MSGPAFFQRCTSCSAVSFPPRLACRACGGAAFEQIEAGPGVVEEVTELPGGLRIASVRARGVLVVCSTPSAVEAGASVALVDSPPGPGDSPAAAAVASAPDTAPTASMTAQAVHLPGSARAEPAALFTTTAHIENEGTP